MQRQRNQKERQQHASRQRNAARRAQRKLHTIGKRKRSRRPTAREVPRSAASAACRRSSGVNSANSAHSACASIARRPARVHGATTNRVSSVAGNRYEAASNTMQRSSRNNTTQRLGRDPRWRNSTRTRAGSSTKEERRRRTSPAALVAVAQHDARHVPRQRWPAVCVHRKTSKLVQGS